MDTIIDYAAIKTRQQAAWSTGDYAVVGTTLQIVGELLPATRWTFGPARTSSTWRPATGTPRSPPRAGGAT